jgi:hypothetical protein
MPYTPTVWQDNVTLVDAAKMNKIETGLAVAPGTELAYNEFTAAVAVSATTEATATTVVTASAVSFDGSTAAWVEFYCPYLDAGAAANNIILVLFQDGVAIGRLGVSTGNGASQPTLAHSSRRRLTPAAGSRTYSVRAQVNAGTGSVGAGAGGAGAYLPGYILITRV